MENMGLDSVLEDVLRSRGQGNLILKPRQKEALQTIVFKGQDCLIVLPTGYGKSLIYQMLPSLFDKISARNLSSKDKSIVIVVSPLNALIDDQINKLKSAGVNCTSLRVCGDEVDGAFEEKILEDLQAGKFELIFTHPEVRLMHHHCICQTNCWYPALSFLSFVYCLPMCCCTYCQNEVNDIRTPPMTFLYNF